MTDRVINELGGGWRSTEVHARSAATGTVSRWLVKWQPRTIECCDRRIVLAGNDGYAPCGVDGSYGDLVDLHSQCGNCGSLYHAPYHAKLIG